MTVRIINADVLDGLRSLNDESVHCVVTSPPYWGLRDYGTGKWDGGDDKCDHRVWGHAADKPTPGGRGGSMPKQEIVQRQTCSKCGARRIDNQIGLEPTLAEHIAKLVEVFREVRRVLRKDGTLWLNYGDAYNSGASGGLGGSTLGGGQNNQAQSNRHGRGYVDGLKPKDLMLMPERLAIALCDDGWYIRSRIIWHKPNPMPESVTDRPTKSHEHIWLMSRSPRYFYDAEALREEASWQRENNPEWNKQRAETNAKKGAGNRNGADGGFAGWSAEQGRNCRDVWTISTSPYSEAHFATFPPELAERCIKAGSPKGGTVLDPFGGSGTTGLVADRLQRNAVLIELNPQYAAMAERRVSRDAGMFANVALEATA